MRGLPTYRVESTAFLSAVLLISGLIAVGCSRDERIQWVRGLGDEENAFSTAITTDQNGNVYVTGRSYMDVVLAKLDNEGELQWSLQWGSFGQWNTGTAVAVDGEGYIYVAGMFVEEVDFDPGTAVHLVRAIDARDCFLSKFSPDGEFQWVVTWDGLQIDRDSIISGAIGSDMGLAVDQSGGVYVLSTDLRKLNSEGLLLWTEEYGGWDLALDELGNIYALGGYSTLQKISPAGDTIWEVTLEETVTHGFAVGADGAIYLCGGRKFLTKCSPTGIIEWSEALTGSGHAEGADIAIDSSQNIFVAGYFRGTVDFDPGPGSQDQTADGDWASFLCQFDSSGELERVRTWCGTRSTDCRAVSVDESGAVFATGMFQGPLTFDTADGETTITPPDVTDIYVIKFLPD